jgi:hypothetical protein
MGDDDVLENLPDSVFHVAAVSLKGIILPDGYRNHDYLHDLEGPKTFAQAEVVLYARAVDPTAPDDMSTEGVYIRWEAEHRQKPEWETGN